MKYIRILDIKALGDVKDITSLEVGDVTQRGGVNPTCWTNPHFVEEDQIKGNEPGKIEGSPEQSSLDVLYITPRSVDRKKIKKIEIKENTGERKYLLTIENKGKIYIISKITENLKNNKWAENANLKFSKSAYDNKYKGIQLELSGRLRGAQRARKMVKKIGSLNQQSFSSKLQFSKRNIYTKWGILGLKVYLNR